MPTEPLTPQPPQVPGGLQGQTEDPSPDINIAPPDPEEAAGGQDHGHDSDEGDEPVNTLIEPDNS